VKNQNDEQLKQWKGIIIVSAIEREQKCIVKSNLEIIFDGKIQQKSFQKLSLFQRFVESDHFNVLCLILICLCIYILRKWFGIHIF
jgi:hypothetical protein